MGNKAEYEAYLSCIGEKYKPFYKLVEFVDQEEILQFSYVLYDTDYTYLYGSVTSVIDLIEKVNQELPEEARAEKLVFRPSHEEADPEARVTIYKITDSKRDVFQDALGVQFPEYDNPGFDA